MNLKLQDRLLIACQEGNIAAARDALRQGATGVPRFAGEPSPLMYAADSGSFDLVKILLEIGADVNYRDDTGSTALECAAVRGDMGVVELLLQWGARDQSNSNAVRPSEYAEYFGFPAVARFIRAAALP